MLREFILTNSKGVSKNLLTDMDTLGFQPEGLGVKISTSTTDLWSNAHIDSRTIDFEPIKLQVLFGYAHDPMLYDPYQAFRRFAEFLTFGPLTLTYKTPAGIWDRTVSVEGLTKTDLVKGDLLFETLELKPISLWYRWKEMGLSSTNPEADLPINNKTFDYSRQFIYTNKLKQTGTTLRYGVNESVYMGLQKDSPVKLVIYGPTTNPSWIMTSQSDGPEGWTTQTDGYNITIDAGQRLEVSSEPGNYKAVKYDATTSTSNYTVYYAQQTNKTNFVRAPLGLFRLSLTNIATGQVPPNTHKFMFKEERVVV